ncbi:aquaporin [Methylosinus sp. Sm6]|uniref:aquaporin n=1 Tax=Methylosinus sp. Sm6 TaxID=2866948 RepID=UPI00351D8B72
MGYIIAQCIGAIAGAAILYAILNGREGGYDVAVAGLGQNGWSNISTASAFLAELVGTFLFLVVILGATSANGGSAQAGIAIGFALVVIHIALIRVTGASVNPARSLGLAVFVGGKAAVAVFRRAPARRVDGRTAVPLAQPRALTARAATRRSRASTRLSRAFEHGATLVGELDLAHLD